MLSGIAMDMSPERETDPLSGLVVVFHDGSYPLRVVEHPFDDKVHRIKFGEHRKVVPVHEFWWLWVRGKVCC
jgi:hypothetical protein